MFINVQECSNLFSSGGAERLASENGLRLLAKIPLDQVLYKKKLIVVIFYDSDVLLLLLMMMVIIIIILLSLVFLMLFVLLT